MRKAADYRPRRRPEQGSSGILLGVPGVVRDARGQSVRRDRRSGACAAQVPEAGAEGDRMRGAHIDNLANGSILRDHRRRAKPHLLASGRAGGFGLRRSGGVLRPPAGAAARAGGAWRPGPARGGCRAGTGHGAAHAISVARRATAGSDGLVRDMRSTVRGAAGRRRLVCRPRRRRRVSGERAWRGLSERPVAAHRALCAFQSRCGACARRDVASRASAGTSGGCVGSGAR